MREFVHKIGKNEFKLICKYEEILNDIESLKGEWETDRYTELYTHEEGNVRKSDFMGDIKDLKNTLIEYINNEELIKTVIEKFPKNAEGFLRKGRVNTINSTCYVCEYCYDFCNAWKIKSLAIIPQSDTVLELIFREEYYKS